MKTPTSRALAIVFVLALLMSTEFSGTATATVAWKSYVDASLISEIVLHDGKLYIATTGGLVLYDVAGGTFEQYTNTIGLPSNFLTSLLFDRRGNIWVGTERSGVARIEGEPGNFVVTSLSATFHGLSDDRITDLAAWGDTLVYATKNGAGLIVEDFPGPRFFKRDGLPSDLVRAVLPDGDHVWMATDSGVVTLDKFGFIRNPSDTLFAAFSLARNDTAVWAGTDRGVAYLKDGETKWVHTKLGPASEVRPVFSLKFDGTRLWAGSRARFFWNDGTGWIQGAIFNQYAKYQMNNTISEIRGLQPMPGGAAYLGGGDPVSERRGPKLLYFDGSAIHEIPLEGLPMNLAWRLDFDVDESLWIATAGFGVAKLTPEGQWFAYNSAAGDTNLTSRFNLMLLADSQGSKWFAQQRYPLQPPLIIDELRDHLDTDRLNDEWTYHAYGEGGGDGLGSLLNLGATEDPDGNRWFLSDEDQQNAPGWWGVNILSRDGSAWRQVNPTSTDPSGQLRGMKGGSAFDVAFAEGGVVYFALKSYGVQQWSTGGFDQQHLFDFSDDTWRTIVQVGASGGIATGAEVRSVAVRSDGVVWIGTTVGLYRYDRGFLTYIPADRGFGVGLLGTIVGDLVLDRQENLWVATNLGLNRIARDNLNDIASFTTPTAWQTQLNLYFPPSAVSQIVDERCERLALHPTKDILFIGTINGLSELDFSSFEKVQPDISKVYVYPNPIRTSRGDASLKIANINSEVQVDIFTIEGDLVHSQTASRAGDSVWDFTTQSGFAAASGVYVVRVRGAGAVVTKTISLIR